MVDATDDDRVLKSQGLIATDILVQDDKIGSDDEVVDAVGSFVVWATGPAHLVAEEIVPEAVWSGSADYCLGQVNNGGHGQFAFNIGMHAGALENVRHGLVAMGASDYLAIFDAFMTIMNSDPARAKAILDRKGFGKPDPDIKQLDKRFFALSNMRQLNAVWLRALPTFRPLPPDQLAAARDAVIARNTLRAAREEHRRKAQEVHETTDPIQVAARATCAQEGVIFETMTAGMPTWDGSIAWFVKTSGGMRTLFLGPEVALLRADMELRARYFFATKSDYPADVGDGTARRNLMNAAPGDVRKQMKQAFRDKRATVPPVTRESLVMTAIFQGLAAFYGALNERSPEVSPALVLPYFGKETFSATYVPRACSPQFSESAEHSLLRLIVGNALWDSALTSKAIKDATIQNPYRTAALLSNLGAAAATAAVGLRLLDADRLAALSLSAPDDLRREQKNIQFQLVEIASWWSGFVPKAVAAYEKAEFKGRFWIVFNLCRRNARLLAERLGPDAVAELTTRFSYFDREYPSAPEAQLPATYDKALATFIRQFAGSRRNAKSWVRAAGRMRYLAVKNKHLAEGQVLVVDAVTARARTKDKWVGAAILRDHATHKRQAFCYLKDGARAPLI